MFISSGARGETTVSQSLIGNSVKIGDGPAAVIGDERRNHFTVHSKLNGKARSVERAESQKTCLDVRRTL